MSALDGLKNYNKDTIDLDYIDGMHYSPYSPFYDGNEESDLTDAFEKKAEIQRNKLPENEDMVELALNDGNFHKERVP